MACQRPISRFYDDTFIGFGWSLLCPTVFNIPGIMLVRTTCRNALSHSNRRTFRHENQRDKQQKSKRINITWKIFK